MGMVSNGRRIKISEIFKSIQGEGNYVGYPMLFIRFSGCTRRCTFCDSSYHIDGRLFMLSALNHMIELYKGEYVCFTGGEPLLHRSILQNIVYKHRGKKTFHIETNGDVLIDSDFDLFSYMCISPKTVAVTKRVCRMVRIAPVSCFDIKVVTDLDKVGVNMIKYATMLMPLSTFNEERDKEIQQKVWKFCIEKNLRFSPRLHVDVWGKRRGV